MLAKKVYFASLYNTVCF